jgi:Mrp family chromosome partitioning ATPase
MSPGSGAGHVSIFEHPRFPQLAEDLRRRFDYVIFDGAPVLAVGDPTILAAQTDLSLLIARGRQTRLAQLDRAFEMLNKAKAPTCLCVLNGMTAGDAEMDGYATGAGYAYAYGYRGRNPNRETDRVPQPQ